MSTAEKKIESAHNYCIVTVFLTTDEKGLALGMHSRNADPKDLARKYSLLIQATQMQCYSVDKKLRRDLLTIASAGYGDGGGWVSCSCSVW